MKLTAQEKTDRGMALNMSELSKVTGYGYEAIRRMNLPLVAGKIRVEDFWRHVAPATPITASLVPALSGDLRSVVDTLRAPSKKHGRLTALPVPSESLVRST